MDPCVETFFMEDELTTVNALIGAATAHVISVPTLDDWSNIMYGTGASTDDFTGEATGKRALGG